MRGAPVSLTASTPATVAELSIDEAQSQNAELAIEEARKQLWDLDFKIENLLESFTQNTGLYVRSIDVCFDHDESRVVRYEVDSEVKL